MQTDVLIVGAGPTGLMLANQLGRRGFRPLIIDRHSGPAQQTRAMAVHARTLEIYSQLGIAGQAIEGGRRGNGANLWVSGRPRARIPLGEIGGSLSPFPYVLMLGQDENERILGARLADFDLKVEWKTELIALEQASGHVRATLHKPDGSRVEVIAQYVAGSDGARSAVRQLNGIAFPGEPYEQVFYVADTEVVGPMVPEELNVYLWRNGFHLFFPMRGTNRWRLIGILPQRFQHPDNIAFQDLVPAIQQEAGAALDIRSCSWFSTYRIAHRCTERFRDRRCFLLGDAAHVHSPMGGQGMNTGLQDAYNLAWKLALVLKGQADGGLLDTYETERMQIARRLLETTDRAFRLVVADGWLAGLLRTRVVARVAALAMRFKRVQRTAFLTLSQTGNRYAPGSLSQALHSLPARGPQPGERFPWLHLQFIADGPREDLFARLDDTRFNLIVIGQSMPAQMPRTVVDSLTVLELPDTAVNVGELAAVGIAGPAFYLLRPDGHIGLAGGSCEPAAIAAWFANNGIRLRLDGVSIMRH